jgi:hypothetical protein
MIGKMKVFLNYFDISSVLISKLISPTDKCISEEYKIITYTRQRFRKNLKIIASEKKKN